MKNSRFGREHVTMDYYLEFVFPEKQIRYIAVTEGEDTEKGLSDFVPFRNLFNEWLAKDTEKGLSDFVPFRNLFNDNYS